MIYDPVALCVLICQWQSNQRNIHTETWTNQPFERWSCLASWAANESSSSNRTRTRTAQIAIIVVYGERARNCCWSIVNEYTVDGASSLKCLNNMHSGNWRPILPSDLRTLCFAWNSSVGMQQFCEATSEQRTYFIKRFLALYKI